MGTRRLDNEPAVTDLIREYTPDGRMPVAVEEPVQVQPLPCVDGSLVSFTVDTTARHWIKKDLRRQFLTILAKDDDIYIGLTEPEVTKSTAAFWPKQIPLVLRSTFDLWIRAANSTSVVTVIQEQWTQ